MRRLILSLVGLGFLVGCGSQEEGGEGAAPSRIAVVGHYDGGISVMDVSDPSNPREIGVCDVGGLEYESLDGDYPYIYAGARSQELVVVDVSDPANPVEVGSLYLDDCVFGIDVVGSYAYIANDDSGLVVVDISDPANPVKVGQCILSSYSYAGYVAVSGNTAYVAASVAQGGIAAIDISNPQNPVEVGHMDIEFPEQVFPVGDTLYVACLTQGLKIIDFSDPTNPVELGSYPAYSCEVVWVEGNYAYIGDTSGILVIDVSDPTNPTKVYQLGESGLFRSPEDIYASDGFLYTVNDDKNSFVVHDISDPAKPVFLGAWEFTSTERNEPVSVFAP